MSVEPDGKPIIEFHNVGYRLPAGQPLLRNVNFTVRRGETLVLIGRSGAGTLAKKLTGPFRKLASSVHLASTRTQ